MCAKMEQEMDKVVEKVDEMISSGQLPDVPYKTALVEGLPEEEVINYSKKMRPVAIVMGTRAKMRRSWT